MPLKRMSSVLLSGVYLRMRLSVCVAVVIMVLPRIRFFIFH